MYRPCHSPGCCCPKATHSPAALCVFGGSPASQGLRLWCEEQAVLRPGCCCPGLGFTHQNARRDVLSHHIHFHSPSPRRRFLTLPQPRELAFVSATSGCPQPLGFAFFAGFWCPSSRRRASLPGGGHQFCQVGSQSEGPPWQGSGELTQLVEQLPLETLHWPSFDLSLAARLVRMIILAWAVFLNWTYFHHGSRLVVKICAVANLTLI